MQDELQTNLKLLEKMYDLGLNFLVNYSFQIIGAIIIFVIGLFVARWAALSVERVCRRHQIDEVLVRFISNTTRIIILVGVGVICLGKFGVSVAPFVAAIGALSLGAGLAMQGVLANYGAGFVIMITRPFTVGDTLSLLGVSGVVTHVNLGTTVLGTGDGETITIPNKQIMGEILTNSKAYKVWEGNIAVSYSTDVRVAMQAIRDVLASEAAVAKDPAPLVGIQKFGPAIVLAYRYWVPTAEYVNLGFRINEKILDAFRQKGLEAPVPLQEVRVLK